MRIIPLIMAVALPFFACAQSTADRIKTAYLQLNELDSQRAKIAGTIEVLKLQQIQEDLDAIGLPALQPGDELVKHSAMTLAYADKFEQARWVAHIITPDVTNGTVFRTNDFRPDEKVTTGSAVEEDYFLKKLKADGSYDYDAFGYDRGHLAPSADFRWSKTALSESYYYSNMSPQLAEFNRGSWGQLEDAIRGYLYSHPGAFLYVVTGPVLKDGLPKIERGKNKVSIPELYWKAVIDINGKKGIGFIMPNRSNSEPLQKFAVTIDDIEKLTGLDLFNKLPAATQAEIESQQDAAAWLPSFNLTDADPLPQQALPKNHFNTVIAKDWAGRAETINVCGRVVGTRKSRAGNILINLDKQFPNQVFTVFVKKEDILNFNYDLTEVLKNKIICVKGRVFSQDGVPTMYIQSQNDINVQQ